MLPLLCEERGTEGKKEMSYFWLKKKNNRKNNKKKKTVRSMVLGEFFFIYFWGYNEESISKKTCYHFLMNQRIGVGKQYLRGKVFC